MRFDHFTNCLELKAKQYAQGTEESAESILDASIQSCAEDLNQLRDMAGIIYFDKADSKMEQTVRIARERATKIILDERLLKKK